MINVLGPRPPSVWSAAEQQVGHGFAGLPLDNVGVQYGLEALKKGQITTGAVRRPERQDRRRRHRHQPDARALRGRPAGAAPTPTAAAAINSANNLDKVAIIDLRGPDPGAFHDAYRSWAIRARLEREHGTFANHVIWFGARAADGRPELRDRGLRRDGPLARGGRGRQRHAARWRRRSSATARATSRTAARRSTGVELVTVPGIGPVCELKEVQTRYGTPRTVAGEGDRDRQQQVHAQAAAAHRLLPDRRSPTSSGRGCRRRSRPASATGAQPGRRARRTRSRGRPTRTAAATSSTAASRSARRPRAPAAAGRAPRSRRGAGEGRARCKGGVGVSAPPMGPHP